MFICNKILFCKRVKRSIYILLTILILWTTNALLRKEKYIGKLLCLEQMINNSQEIVLDSLNKIDRTQLSEREQALFYLLLFQEDEKYEQIFPTDSLLQISIDYYTRLQDSARLFQAYYLRGRLFHQQNYYFEAIENYQTAENYINASNNNKIKYLLYHHIGRIYQFKSMREEKSKAARRELEYAKLLNDIVLYCSTLNRVADNFSDSIPLESINLLQQARRLAPANQSKLIASILRKLSKNYLQINRPDSALYFINQAMQINKEEKSLSPYYQLKAEAYYRLNQSDSAQFYLRYCMNTPLPSIKLPALYELYELKKQQKEDTQALEYLELYVKYRDSLDKARKENFIDHLQDIQAYKQQKQKALLLESELDDRKEKFYQFMLISLAAIIVLIFIVYNYQNEKKKQKKKIRQSQREAIEAQLGKKEIEYQLLQEKEVRNKMEVQRLHQNIAYYKRLNEITLPILLKELDSKNIKAISENEWQVMIDNTNACFDNFTTRLNQKFPGLDENDIKFCCLVKMELSLSLLAAIYHIAKGSISRKKMRMKEKMEITTGSFDDFIRNF